MEDLTLSLLLMTTRTGRNGKHYQTWLIGLEPYCYDIASCGIIMSEDPLFGRLRHIKSHLLRWHNMRQLCEAQCDFKLGAVIPCTN